MKYRLDKHGNELSVLGFGCMRFPKSIDETEKLILYAIENGINYFDTAYIYGDSEKVLGTILKKNNLRDKIYIATKLPLMNIRKREDFDRYFNTQLERLQVDYIDYYFMHCITDMDMWLKFCEMGIEEWIKEKLESGKIKQIGFSFHGPEQDFLKVIDAYNWDFCMIQYNYMNINYQAGKTGLLRAHEKGIPVMIMEPLLGGKLATNLPKKAMEAFKKVNSNATPAAWALNWLWNQKEPVVILSGMSSMRDVKENIGLAKKAEVGMLNEKEINTINEVIKIFGEADKINCTGCNYCMPCPMNVNIPVAFLSYNTYYAMSRIEGLKQYTMSIGMNAKKKVRIANCTKCGICEKKCPQNIPIMKELKIVRKKIEPFWMRGVLKVAKIYLNRK